MVKTMTKISCDPYNRSTDRRKGIILGLPLALLTFSLLPYLTEGLTCYECLSLSCDSGAICESTKDIMVKIFVPKSHFIHFDPREHCPESENPYGNSTLWANISRECHRSDSFCLVAPIEVLTTFDGTKSGEKLESKSQMSSVGYLRGCVSRRKLLEVEDTLKVEVPVTDDSMETPNGNHSRTNHNGSNGHSNSSSSSGGGSVPQHSHDNHRHHQHQNQNSAMKDIVFHTKNGGTNNNDPGSSRHSQLLNNNSFGDGFIITKIYSHVFYIDQGTSNATRCLADNCNNRIKQKRESGAISVTFTGITSLVYYAAVVTNCLRYY